jgi:hypothetical protein
LLDRFRGAFELEKEVETQGATCTLHLREKSAAFQVPRVGVVHARVAKAVSRRDGHPAFAVDVNALSIVASAA